MKKIFSAGIAILLFVSACSKKNDVNPTSSNTTGKIKIGQSMATGSGMNVTLYQDSAFLTGYNKLYLVVTDSVSSAVVPNATASISTGMQMSGMTMTSPVEQPVYNSTNKLYTAASVFSMATGNGMGQWNVMVNVKNPANGKQGMASFMVNVNDRKYSLTTSAVGSDGQTYMITLLQPLKPQVGLNTLELLVDKQVDAMTYSPVSTFQVQVTPEMPAMNNMTSNGNQNPIVTTNGHYVGKVNLSMTGDWKLDINLLNGQTAVVSDAYIEFAF